MIRTTTPNEIFIDREGVWYFGGAEMKRKDIVHYFYKYLKRDPEGRYQIEIENDRCRVVVEDAPYVVKSIDVGFCRHSNRPAIDVSLNDGSREGLSLDAPLRIGDDHILYCKVKEGEHEARFSRPAYYQFCRHIDYDSQRGEYRLLFNQRSYPLFLIKKWNRQESPEER
ncbi:MAG: DUF1285 domain-containing protein [Deltaproteobacteria bacterium]|nr:DUF1285 domain-containing protein [Deltaproteobacteria bacterium]